MEALSSGDFGTHDWVDVVVAVGLAGTPVEVVTRALVHDAATPEIVIIASPHIVGSDFVLSQHRPDVECAVFHERGGPVVII